MEAYPRFRSLCPFSNYKSLSHFITHSREKKQLRNRNRSITTYLTLLQSGRVSAYWTLPLLYSWPRIIQNLISFKQITENCIKPWKYSVPILDQASAAPFSSFLTWIPNKWMDDSMFTWTYVCINWLDHFVSHPVLFPSQGDSLAHATGFTNQGKSIVDTAQQFLTYHQSKKSAKKGGRFAY